MMTKIDGMPDRVARICAFLLAVGAFLLLLLVFRLTPINPAKHAKVQPVSQPVIPLFAADTLNVQVFLGEKGWGYDLFVNHRRFIHQPTIPAVAGNRGFSSRAQAKQVAQLAARKMRQSRQFPSFTREELDSLGILTP